MRKLAAIFFLIFGTWLWARYFRKLCVVQSIEYHENGKKKKVNHYNCESYQTAGYVISTRWVMMFLLLGIVATSLIILLI